MLLLIMYFIITWICMTISIIMDLVLKGVQTDFSSFILLFVLSLVIPIGLYIDLKLCIYQYYLCQDKYNSFHKLGE